VEIPSDVNGMIYVTMDAAGNWKNQLDSELKSAGYSV
jgi:predicted nucleotide-binding protein